MKRSMSILLFVGLAITTAGSRLTFPSRNPLQQEAEDAIPEADGEHLRIVTEHGPLHLWRPETYDPSTAGLVIYIHGYYVSVDQTWTDDFLATQFRDSGRNALFIAINAPRSNAEDVRWKSLEELLSAVEERVPFALPRGPLVVAGHSGAYRTILMWLRDPRVQYVILLDGLYAGETEFRDWLRPQPHILPHHMVLVANGTWWQSTQFARRIYGTARRSSIPAKSSSFTSHEIHAPLLYLRSQYDHNEIISSGRVIPVLLQIAPLSALSAPEPQTAKSFQSLKCWSLPCSANGLPSQ